jgi:CMP-2-keto-3-deoxyoctulosonic acid synthetase
MNRIEHLLVIFAEECSEVAQETSKALRFGVNEQRDLPTSNLERIEKEFSQLLAMREMLMTEGVYIHLDEEVMKKKKAKVEEYLLYSKECGTLNP